MYIEKKDMLLAMLIAKERQDSLSQFGKNRIGLITEKDNIKKRVKYANKNVNNFITFAHIYIYIFNFYIACDIFNLTLMFESYIFLLFLKTY